jgi:hypothetical protein
MTADDLSTPLGRTPAKRQRRLPVNASQVVAGALALFFIVFVGWAIIGDDPYGGEPMVAVPVDLHVPATTRKSDAPPMASATDPSAAANGQPRAKQAAPGPPGKTVTIIDGKTGARQEIVVPQTGNSAGFTEITADEQRFYEITAHGPIPKIATDGERPMDAFARPIDPIPGRTDAPRIAIVISGLGISATTTSEAIGKLPSAVSLSFVPYASSLDRVIAMARGAGHEVLLQVPMEPFGYPENDPGPQTLLTSLAVGQNIDRLYWLMSRFQGYVGVVGASGARFMSTEQSFAPILREIAKRGLMFVDDGANPRSIASRLAGGDSTPFAKADLTIDAVPTPVEIDRALGRLEMAARERGLAVGMASALPVSIDHIVKWSKAVQSRGIVLVPITAAIAKPKPS